MTTKTKVKSKTKKKSTRKATTKTPEAIKKKENMLLLRKIYRYERNFTEAISSVYENDDQTLTSILLYVALYPQLQNHLNSHDYKEFHFLLQNDEAFKSRVYANEKPETNLEEEAIHYSLVPLLHQQLLDAVREIIISGAGRKFNNTINKIADAVRSKGDELCDSL